MIYRNGRICRGLGAVTPPPELPQLAALTSGNPAFASSWNQIQSQLVAEGADPTQFQGAQQALVDSWTQLTGQQFGVADDQALAAATQYVMQAQTLQGAQTIVKSLVTAMQSGQPPSPVLVQQFTGTMIGTLEVVGALSTGVGAAIVGAVGLALSLLQAAAPLLFGSPPSGTQVCPGVYVTQTPAAIVGCMAIWGPDGTAASFISTSPMSSAWRNFPDPTNPPDQWWYQTHSGGPSTPWEGADFSTTWGVDRQVDFAFPVYRWIECDVANASDNLLAFQQAFFSAWKANAAYALNGLQPQPDYVVLAHVCLLWNRVNPTGTPYTIAPVQASGSVGPYVAPSQLPCNEMSTGGSGTAPWTTTPASYMQSLVQAIIDNPIQGLGSNGSVVINLPHLNITTQPAGSTSTPAQTLPPAAPASSTSNVAIGAAAIGAVGVGGLFAYASMNGLTMTEALRRIFR